MAGALVEALYGPKINSRARDLMDRLIAAMSTPPGELPGQHDRSCHPPCHLSCCPSCRRIGLQQGSTLLTCNNTVKNRLNPYLKPAEVL